MADSEDNIPTLTTIIHPGDIEMLNHFDAHQFNDEQEDENTSTAIENASEFENTEFDEIPSIQIEESSAPVIDESDFTDVMHAIADNNIEQNLSPAEADNDIIKEQIDQAITDALPGIEAHLKEQLYNKFGL